MAARIVGNETVIGSYQWSDVVITALEADGRRRTIVDSGLDRGRPAVDTTAAGVFEVTGATDDRRRPSMVTGAADDRRCPLLVTGAGDVSVTSSGA